MDYRLKSGSEFKQSTPRSPISFLEALTLLFIGLKLTNVIAWSWFWVLSPLIIPTIVLIAVVVFVGIYILVTGR